MKGIAVLGSTGTIGENTLALVSKFSDRFQVVSLAAGKNMTRLREQIRQFRPELVSLTDPAQAQALQAEFPEIEILCGTEGVTACATHPDAQLVVVGVVGFAALAPTLAAVSAGKTVALANKEALVVAGALLKKEASCSQATVIPVDSEHNAIYQLLLGRPLSEVSTIVLTASGGPLLRKPDLPLRDVTPAIAIQHPNWKMGPKISVDSATLMNKGLELIEAHYLFGLPEERIEVWIHPQSIVHGAVWLTDNSCLAQLSTPDMRSAIGYALSYPERLPHPIPKLSLSQLRHLEFFEPDLERFPSLQLARESLRAGPSHLVALNAANEIAVEAFLRGALLFSRIPSTVQHVLEKHRPVVIDHLDAIRQIDAESRRVAIQHVGT